ncbi:hypothetical protein ACH4F6_15245 [Streptomyces sp. NPDC017936]
MRTNPLRAPLLLRSPSPGLDRRLTVRRHVDLGRCASAFCTAG